MSLPMDPDECVGTPEYQELFDDRISYIAMLLDQEAEDEEDRPPQYPYRHTS